MFGKIFEQIYNSTVCQDWQVLIVFQQCIILSDELGILDMTPEAISRRTGIPVDIILRGIEELEKPDPRSRSTKSGGRRLERIDSHRDWGWVVVNKVEYRKLASRLEKQEKDKERIAKKREESRVSLGVADNSDESQDVADVAHTDTDTDTDTRSKKAPERVPKTEHGSEEDPPENDPPVEEPRYVKEFEDVTIGGRPEPEPLDEKKNQKQSNRGLQAYVVVFRDMFQQKFGRMYVMSNFKEDIGHMSFVYAQLNRDMEKLKKLIAKYFESDDKRVVDNGWNIRTFRATYNAIAAKVFGDVKAAEPWRI